MYDISDENLVSLSRGELAMMLEKLKPTVAMCVLSLLPVGLLQTKASVEHSYWYARSSEFMQTDLMQTLRWMRFPTHNRAT